jgi:hypothetical protein
VLSYEDLEVARENCAAKIKRRPVKAMGKLAGSCTRGGCGRAKRYSGADEHSSQGSKESSSNIKGLGCADVIRQCGGCTVLTLLTNYRDIVSSLPFKYI